MQGNHPKHSVLGVINGKIFTVQHLEGLIYFIGSSSFSGLSSYHATAELAYVQRRPCLFLVMYSLELLSDFPEAPSEPHLCHFPFVWMWQGICFGSPVQSLRRSFGSGWAVEAWGGRGAGWQPPWTSYTHVRFSPSSAVLCLPVGDICRWGHCWSICLHRQESGK